MRINTHNFDLEHEAYIMGILNVTPDSFSDGGKWTNVDTALSHVEQMITEGASIIDVGGESTRPGYERISDEEEISRVAPVIEAIRERFDVAISIDTYKSDVAREAIRLGAGMVNDIWGFRADDQMASLVANTGVACCLMHNRKEPVYDDYMKNVCEDLAISIELARKAGVAKEQIIIDPGVGFAKSFEQNLIVIRELAQLQKLGYPILLATSRKSVIGLALDLDREQRVEGTVATTVMGLERGASVFRVHDVKENYRAMKMAQKVLEAR